MQVFIEVPGCSEAAMTTKETKRLQSSVTAMYGPPGSLKSSFALSWPKKIAFYDFDFGVHRAWGMKQVTERTDIGMYDAKWEYFGEPNVVLVRRQPLPHRSFTHRYAKLEGYIEYWATMINQLIKDCQDESIRTIIFDTGTIEWSICCDAYLQELQEENEQKKQPLRKQLQQIEYGEPNRRQKQIYDMVKSSGKDLIMVHHETDEYAPYLVNGVVQKDEGGRPVSIQTGKKIPDGFRQTLKICDWELYTPSVEVKGYYCAVIKKSAMGLDLIDMELGGISGKGTEKEITTFPTYQGLVDILTTFGRL